jgi:hypothetical protein
MITFELLNWPETSELDEALDYLNITAYWVSGFEDFGGYQMSTRYVWIEYIRFANDSDAALFVLTYGDKYQPQKTDREIKHGITPYY